MELYEIPTQPTIRRILRDASKTLAADNGLNPKTMRPRPSAVPRLEDVLYRWMCAQSKLVVMLNASLVRMKGAQLLEEANKHRPVDGQISLQFSKGSVEIFKKRSGLRFRRVYGKAMSADVESIVKHMPRIRVVVTPFATRKI